MIGKLDGELGKVISSEQLIRPEVLAFKAEIAKADGKLLQLRKLTKGGEKIYISARLMKKPDKPIKKEYESNYFWSWNTYIDSVVAINVYTGNLPSDVVPIGHKDWLIQKDQASGGGNVHEAFISTNEYERLSQKRWAGNTAFKTDEEYQGQDIGTLMLATSSVVLPAVGVKVFHIGTLLEPAEKTYKRFGLTISDFIVNNQLTDLPVERLSQSAKVDEVISEFV